MLGLIWVQTVWHKVLHSLDPDQELWSGSKLCVTWNKLCYMQDHIVFLFVWSDSSRLSQQFFYDVSNRAMGWFAYVEQFLKFNTNSAASVTRACKWWDFKSPVVLSRRIKQLCAPSQSQLPNKTQKFRVGHLSPVPRLWGWTILYLLNGRDDNGQNPLIMSCGTDLKERK